MMQDKIVVIHDHFSHPINIKLAWTTILIVHNLNTLHWRITVIKFAGQWEWQHLKWVCKFNRSNSSCVDLFCSARTVVIQKINDIFSAIQSKNIWLTSIGEWVLCMHLCSFHSSQPLPASVKRRSGIRNSEKTSDKNFTSWYIYICRIRSLFIFYFLKTLIGTNCSAFDKAKLASIFHIRFRKFTWSSWLCENQNQFLLLEEQLNLAMVCNKWVVKEHPKEMHLLSWTLMTIPFY